MTFRPASIAVLCNRPDRQAAERAAALLQCPLLVDRDPAQVSEAAFVLFMDEQGVALRQTGPGAPGPIRVDFLAGAVDHRRRQGGGKGQLIAKAAGLKPGVFPHVLDLTAGLGRDGFVLASLGCRVTLVERSPLVHLLLSDGLARASESADEALAAILDRMELVEAEASNYLSRLTEPPDVVYLDPMFPERRKTALVKKEMRAFHDLVGRDEDAHGVLDKAIETARYRVVVKRPRKAICLGQRQPSHQLQGKTSRFDVYTKRALPGKLGNP